MLPQVPVTSLDEGPQGDDIGSDCSTGKPCKPLSTDQVLAASRPPDVLTAGPPSKLPGSHHPLETPHPTLPSSGNQKLTMDQGGLGRHPLLTGLSLAINIEYGLLICTTCRMALTTSNFLQHLKKTENLDVSPATSRSVHELCQFHKIAGKYPNVEPSTSPIAYIKGVAHAIKSGCGLCPYTADMKQVMAHYKKEHHATSGPPEIIDSVPCQALHLGQAKRNIRVILPASPSDPLTSRDAVLSDFTNFSPYTESSSSHPADARLINPWILQTGFHTLLKGHSVPELRQLVALPGPSDIPLSNLSSVVNQLFDESTKLLAKTSPDVRRMINSNDANM